MVVVGLRLRAARKRQISEVTAKSQASSPYIGGSVKAGLLWKAVGVRAGLEQTSLLLLRARQLQCFFGNGGLRRDRCNGRGPGHTGFKSLQTQQELRLEKCSTGDSLECAFQSLKAVTHNLDTIVHIAQNVKGFVTDLVHNVDELAELTRL